MKRLTTGCIIKTIRDVYKRQDWERLYEAIVREQEKRKWINGKNNTEGNNSPALR